MVCCLPMFLALKRDLAKKKDDGLDIMYLVVLHFLCAACNYLVFQIFFSFCCF